jgi:nicotinic acid mononucleotide adenylyltransferase
MSAEASDEFIRAIHAAPLELVLAITGGGSRAISALLEVPGASRTVLAAVVPYSAAALSDWLEARPEHFCDDRTARAMAMAAYQRAIRLAESPGASSPAPPLAGVACTASLASDRPKRGAHRLHAALQTEALTIVQSLELTKGARSRLEEEQLAAAIVLNLIAEACGLEERLELDLKPSEQIILARAEAPRAWQDLLAGRIACASSRGERAPSPGETAQRPRRAIFAGAFNPLHDGHRLMARVAAERLQLPVEFEVSIINVDKPPLDFLEMQRRAEQFGVNEKLWFTTAATFVEKAAIFAPATFVVGVDTIERIAEAKYYASEAACREAIQRLASLRCQFLVFGRQVAGSYASLGDLALPESLRHICREVPEAAFRADVSSTELRRAVSQPDQD